MKRKRNLGGRPVLFPGAKPRTVTLTDEAYQKAGSDAEVLSGANGITVSTSQAIDAAVRAFDPKKFKV